jgi:hypothetical protein
VPAYSDLITFTSLAPTHAEESSIASNLATVESAMKHGAAGGAIVLKDPNTKPDTPSAAEPDSKALAAAHVEVSVSLV